MGRADFLDSRDQQAASYISKLTEQGYKVVFDVDESYIYHKKSKQVIRMRKERGVYVVDAYVPKKPDSSFTRQR